VEDDVNPVRDLEIISEELRKKVNMQLSMDRCTCDAINPPPGRFALDTIKSSPGKYVPHP
jgi:hypothetical protein